MNIKKRAKECAGNWLEFESFAWHEKPDNPEDWYVWYTHNRDSGLLTESNAEYIKNSLEQFVDDVRAEHHHHWAVGWVAGFAIRVYRDGEITRAFKAVVELLDNLENYVILDEDHYSELEHEAALDGIRQSSLGAGIDLSCGLEYKIFDWLCNNEPEELENHDGTGAYPGREAIERAVKALVEPAEVT